MIAKMDLFSVANVLGNTVQELRTRAIPPLHAEAIFEAAIIRLEHLMAAQLSSRPSADPAPNSIYNNRLHILPLK